MATAAIALNTWSIEYYETMAAAERARLDVTRVNVTKKFGLRGKFALVRPFRDFTRLTEHLVSRLAKLETYPSSFLLEEDAANIPRSLRELFRSMCDLLQKAETEGLQRSFLLKSSIEQMGRLSQEVIGFAVRYEEAQIKLRSRVPADEVQAYGDALEAYRNCDLKSEQATDDDVKTKLLNF